MQHLRYCKRCDTEKPTMEFGRNKRHPDGLAFYCRACSRDINREHAARKRAGAQPMKRGAKIGSKQRRPAAEKSLSEAD